MLLIKLYPKFKSESQRKENNKMKHKIAFLAVAALLAGGVYGVSQMQSKPHSPETQQIAKKHHIHFGNWTSEKPVSKNQQLDNSELDKIMQAPIPQPMKYYGGRRMMKLESLDYLHRAQASHIQLKASEMPQAKRIRLTYNPSGWHNYKFTTRYQGKKRYVWLYNRGHLVGYQFSGLNDEPRNLITQTAYTNQGSLHGMVDNNPDTQIYYEMKLRKWLLSHPQDSLDYSVTPVYANDDLVPSRIVFTYLGYKPNGQKVRIHLGGGREKQIGKITSAVINNISPQAKIDYRTGRAIVFSK